MKLKEYLDEGFKKGDKVIFSSGGLTFDAIFDHYTKNGNCVIIKPMGLNRNESLVRTEQIKLKK